MKKLLLTITMMVSLFASEYSVNKYHSTIKFEASKLLFVGVSGEFSEFSGTIQLDNNDKLKKISGLIAINSINTANEERDEHLKANDYFFVDKYPNIIFQSTIIKDNKLKAKVSIKGIEKELEFQIGEVSLSNNTLDIKLTSVINRQEFMLNGSMSGIISDDVTINAHIVAYKIR